MFQNFIRLRLNTLQLAAGMKGKVNRAEAHQSEGGLNLLNHFNGGIATAQFRFDTPQLAAGSFIRKMRNGSGCLIIEPILFGRCLGNFSGPTDAES